MAAAAMGGDGTTVAIPGRFYAPDHVSVLVGQTVQWDVMAMGSEHHTFHVHGHRWRENGVPRDTKTVGPAESFAIRWKEDAPGTWLYHCHVEAHMNAGMIGIYQVKRRKR